jgi:phage-related protein
MPVNMPVTGKILRKSSPEYFHRTLKAQFGDGYSQRAPDGLNAKTVSWTVEWGALTQAELTAVMDALDSVGGWDYINWVPLYQTVSKKFILRDGKYRVTHNSNNDFSVSCILDQVFDL